MTTLPEYTVTVINNNGILQPSSTNPPTVTTQAVAVGANAVGVNTSIQYNLNGLFGGSNNFTYNPNTQVLTIGILTINSTSFSGQANDSLHLGGVSLSTLETYITSNSATAYSNSIAYSGNASQAYANVLALSYVNTAQLASNLALYQTSAGLAANVVTLTANNSTNFGGLSLITVEGYITSNAATAYSNAIAYSGNAAQAYANVIALSYVNTAQLASNLALYQTSAGLASNVLTLTANNSTYFGGLSLITVEGYITSNAATAYSNAVSYSGNASQAYANVIALSYVNTSQLSSNLALYQTTAGLASNVVTLTANNTNFVGTVSAANVVSNAQLQANLTVIQGYITSNSATAYSNAIAYSGNAAQAYANVIALSYVNTSQLASNLALYQTTAGLAANVLTLTANNTNFVGTVSAANVVSNAQLQANLSAYQLNSTLNANIASYLPTYTGVVNGSSHTVGTSFTANSSGVYTTGIVNASSGNVGVLNVVGNTTVGGSLTVTGNLYTVGNTFIVNSTVITSNDTLFILANGAATASLANGAGLVIGSYANLVYISTGSAFQSNANFIPSTNNLNLGSTTNLWNVYANQISGTLTTASQPNITANNSTNFGGLSLSTVQGYITGNSATAYSNAIAYSGNAAQAYANVIALSYVNTSQLSSNLALYQTSAGLASNVATLTANNSTNFGGLSLTTVQGYITGNSATAYSNAIAYSGNAAQAYANVIALSYVNTSQLSSNLALYQTTAGLASNVATLTANNTTYFNGQLASYYTNATNITTGTLPYAQLGANVVNTSANFTITGMHTYSNGITFSNTITANSSNGSAGQVLTSSGATGNVYWSTVSSGSVNTAAQYAWTNTHTFSANVGIGSGITTPAYTLQVNGSFVATTKSFLIKHPTKKDKQLRYASLEGPENGVYLRGKLTDSNKIMLPEYWTKLVDVDSITVELTPIGKYQKLYVKDVTINYIELGMESRANNPTISCFYTVYAERIDVPKLLIEI